ncbi:hypothetical protein BJX62DRAFT_218513 [Aspergillus germanicus]
MANSALFPLPGPEEDVFFLVCQGTDPSLPMLHNPPLLASLDLVRDISLFNLENELLLQNVRKSQTPKCSGYANLTQSKIQQTSDTLLGEYDADTFATNPAGNASIKSSAVEKAEELADCTSYSTSRAMATSNFLVSDTSSQWDRAIAVPQQQRPASHAPLNITWGDTPDRDGRQRKQAGRRKSHNIVERRYRVNLNSKFRRLQDVVLEGTHSSPSPTGPMPPTRLDGVEAKMLRGVSSPKSTFSKADILDIAMSYIKSLEEQMIFLRETLDVVEGSGGKKSWS